MKRVRFGFCDLEYLFPRISLQHRVLKVFWLCFELHIKLYNKNNIKLKDILDNWRSFYYNRQL